MKSTEPLNILELAQLEESRQSCAVAAIADISEPLAGGTLCFDGPGSHCNQAVNLAMSGPITGPEIDHFISFYQSRGFQPQLELCPFAHDSLIEGLALRGFVIKGFETVLARDMSLAPPQQSFPDITISQLNPDDENQVETFLKIVVDGFGVPSIDSFRKLAIKALRYPNTFAYLASIDGTPAAGGSCEV